MTFRYLTFCCFFTLLLPALAGAQQVSANDIQVMTSECKFIMIVHAKAISTQNHTDNFAAVAEDCDRLNTALQSSDESRVQQAARDLRLALTRLNRPPASAQERLAYMEASVPASGLMRFYKLADMAKVAFEAGEFDKARSYANELLQTASQYAADWNYGNAIYYGNFVLGRLAVRDRDLTGAGIYLLDAARTPGSPQLNSFGPNVTLAKELLEQGQGAAVLQFLTLCKNFWRMDRGRLDEWSATVRDGGIPAFRSNLNY